MEPTILLSSIKTVIDITKSISNLSKKDSPLDDKARELTKTIIDTQSQILTMYAEYQKVLQSNHDIAQKLMELENWKKKKSEYKLIEISKGVVVYALDPIQSPSIPEHFICKNCYNDRIASILDPVYIQEGGSQFVCPRCKTVINTHVDSPNVFSLPDDDDEY